MSSSNEDSLVQSCGDITPVTSTCTALGKRSYHDISEVISRTPTLPSLDSSVHSSPLSPENLSCDATPTFVQRLPTDSSSISSKLCDEGLTCIDHETLLSHLRAMERSCRCEQTTLDDPLWIESQRRMMIRRRKVVEWMNDWCDTYDFCDQTRYYALSLLDRCRPGIDFSDRVQHVSNAVACLWLAIKFQEVYTGSVFRNLLENVSSLKYVTADSVLEAEVRILRAVDFNISVPTPYDFIGYYLFAADAMHRFFATFACDVAIFYTYDEMDNGSISTLYSVDSSLLAAAVAYLALECVRQEDGSVAEFSQTIDNCEYSRNDDHIRPIVDDLRSRMRPLLASARIDPEHRFSIDPDAPIIVRRAREREFMRLLSDKHRRMTVTLDHF